MDNIFEIINRFRETAPVDVEGLTRELGLELRYERLDRQIAGMIEKCGNTYLITINDRDVPTRQRFTLAHELGHYVHHRDKIGDGVVDDKMYRNTGAFHNNKIGEPQETQANQFAANLLMPWELINKLRESGVRGEQETADRLGVSLQAFCIRVGAPYPPR